MDKDIQKLLNSTTEDMKVGILKGSFDSVFNNVITNKKSLSTMINPSKRLIINEALQDIVFACIDKRANAIASLDFEISRAGKPVSPINYIHNLLRNPNPLFTWYEFIYLINVYLLSLGEVFIYILRGKYNVIKELWILPSQNMRVEYPATSGIIADTKYVLETEEVTSKNGIVNSNTFSYKDIVYMKIPNPKDVYRGAGVLESALLSNDINLGAKTYVRDFYRNGAIPGGYLQTDKTLAQPEITRIKSSWDTQHRTSADEAWKIAVLYGGLSYHEVSVNPASADFISQSTWSREDIMAMFGVPPVVLGYPTQNGGAKEQHQLFYKLTVYPDTVKIAYSINQLFFGRIPKLQSYSFRFKNIMPVDDVVQVDKARVGATFGAITINELRNLLGLPNYSDSIVGSQLVIPLNNPPGGGNISAQPKGVVTEMDKTIEKSLQGVKSVYRS